VKLLQVLVYMDGIIGTLARGTDEERLLNRLVDVDQLTDACPTCLSDPGRQPGVFEPRGQPWGF